MKNIEDDIEQLKKELRNYGKDDVEFSAHAENQISLRGGKKEEIIELILNPEKLVYSYIEKGSQGDAVHCLNFRISNTRTIRLPVIFNRGSKKNLYIITYIMRHRSLEHMIRKRSKHG